MKPHDAEKLLGGYAAGILTDEEKRALFQAALDHQEIFDALADEEALRALLADPVARQRLLAAIPETKGVQRFWRNPTVMSLAATLMVAMLGGLAYWRHGSMPEDAPRKTAPIQPEQASPKIADAVPRTTPPEALAHPVQQRKVEAIRETPVSTPKGTGVPAAMASDDERVKPHKDKLREVAASELAEESVAAGSNAIIIPGAVDQMLAKTDLQMDRASKARDAQAEVSIPPSRSAPPPQPTHRVERLDAARVRLHVTWSVGSHGYLLKRGHGSVQVLSQVAPPGIASNIVSARYEFECQDTDIIDFYVLSQPVSDPARLPAEGPLQGFRQRIFMDAKK